MPSTISPRRTFTTRSLSFWVLWLAFAWTALSGWLRAVDSIINWYWLNFAGVRPGPLYLVITGFLWGLAGLIVVIWLLMRWPWYRSAGLAAALFFAITYWVDRLLFGRAPGLENNALFAALVTLLALIYVVVVLRPHGEISLLFMTREERRREIYGEKERR